MTVPTRSGGRSSPARKSLPVLPNSTGAKTPANGASNAQGVRIALLTLGCDKNTVDSERVQARLVASGAQVSADLNSADVVLVNTCGFIDVAKEESVDALLQAARLKQEGRIQAVVAMGCLVQRYKEQLSAEIPEVDLFVGLTEMDTLVPRLRERGLLQPEAPNMQQPMRRLATATRYTSFLKVSEGCDHTCAFCAIPLMRGKHRSAPIEQLVAEAQELERAGVVELNLISQDTTWYGRDLVRGLAAAGDGFAGRTFQGMKGIDQVEQVRALRPEGTREHKHGLLNQLLEALLRETSIAWLRLFYMYPSGISHELVELMARERRIVPYLDMPIQHGSDRILTLMRRPERRATILERVGWLRSALPDLALRTTVIVGFPGETEEDFQALLEVLGEVRFDYLGAFTYSVEEDTLAATLPGQVPDAVKRERLEELLDLQRSITRENNEARIGRVTPALIDRLTDRAETGAAGAVGRTTGQGLEVDGVLHIADARGLKAGNFVNVELTDATEYDLAGVVVARPHENRA